MSVISYDDTIVDPKYLDWLEYPIIFSRANQWANIPYLGHFPLILDPIIKSGASKRSSSTVIVPSTSYLLDP
jgi:hypothetical protein